MVCFNNDKKKSIITTTYRHSVLVVEETEVFELQLQPVYKPKKPAYLGLDAACSPELLRALQRQPAVGALDLEILGAEGLQDAVRRDPLPRQSRED